MMKATHSFQTANLKWMQPYTQHMFFNQMRTHRENDTYQNIAQTNNSKNVHKTTQNALIISDIIELNQNNINANKLKTYQHPQASFQMPGHSAPGRAHNIYTEWKSSFVDEAIDYSQNIEQKAEAYAEQGSVDELEQKMTDDLDTWLEEQKGKLEETLEQANPGVRNLFEKRGYMDQVEEELSAIRDNLMEEIEGAVENIIEDLPPDVPPVIPPTDGGSGDDGDGDDDDTGNTGGSQTNNIPYFSSDTIFESGTIEIEAGVIGSKVSLTLKDSSRIDREDAMFFVEDALGNKKSVSIEFESDRLEKLFKEKFQDSDMYHETLSLEKFNMIMDRLESYMDDMSEVEWERLKSKINGEEEQNKFDNIFNHFTNLLHEARIF